MVRWSIIGVVTITAIVVVLYFLSNRSGRDLQRTQQHAATTTVESSSLAPAKPTPKIAARPSDIVVNPTQEGLSCEQVRKAANVKLKPPVAQGPLKVLKGVYQDESRDATSEDAERRIRAQFDPETFPVDRIRTVTCHKSVCKIGVLWSNEQPMILAGVAMKAHQIPTREVAFDPVTEPDAKGDVLFEIYILREGLTLEDFE